MRAYMRDEGGGAALISSSKINRRAKKNPRSDVISKKINWKSNLENEIGNKMRNPIELK